MICAVAGGQPAGGGHPFRLFSSKEFSLAHHHLGMIFNLFHVTGKLQVIIWSMVLGFWLLVFGLRALGFGRLSLVFELRSVAVGLRSCVFEIPDEKFARRL